MAEQYKMQLEWWPIENVKPYLRNAKKHPQAQVSQLARQIIAHGFDQPIVVDGQGVIIKGHGRRLAAIEAKLVEVPVVVRKDLTEEQCRLARIADNRLPEYGETDEDALRFEFGTLATHEGMDLTLTGFELSSIEKIMADGEAKDDLSSGADSSGDNAGNTANQFIVSVHCKDEAEMQELYGELSRRGLEVKLIT